MAYGERPGSHAITWQEAKDLCKRAGIGGLTKYTLCFVWVLRGDHIS